MLIHPDTVREKDPVVFSQRIRKSFRFLESINFQTQVQLERVTKMELTVSLLAFVQISEFIDLCFTVTGISKLKNLIVGR